MVFIWKAFQLGKPVGKWRVHVAYQVLRQLLTGFPALESNLENTTILLSFPTLSTPLYRGVESWKGKWGRVLGLGDDHMGDRQADRDARADQAGSDVYVLIEL
jgi:hypothetical protein